MGKCAPARDDASTRTEQARSPRPGEIWDVTYAHDLRQGTGFLNRDGLHSVYVANGGQLYFKRLQPDGAIGNIGCGNPVIVSARLVATTGRGCQ